MGRKKKNAALDDKIAKYLQTYELDDLNEANDMAQLMQMCALELNMEQIQRALGEITDPVKEARTIKDLQSSLKDAIASYTTLQGQLGINRSNRQSEADESPLQYIQRIQQLSKKFLDSRLKSISCPKCKQVLMKYLIYVEAKGEDGSIESKTKKPAPYKHTLRVQCWKCGEMVTISNEEIVLAQK